MAQSGTHWKEFSDEYGTNYTLVDAAEKPITDWVTITTDPAGIANPAVSTATTVKNTYTIGGVRLAGEPNQLPKGLYIVNGKKVVNPK